MTRTERIHAVLTEQFAPVRLDIVDNSRAHAGHLGASNDSETHLQITLVSSHFTGLRQVERQRRIYATLASEFQRGLHALELRALTPEEAQPL